MNPPPFHHDSDAALGRHGSAVLFPPRPRAGFVAERRAAAFPSVGSHGELPSPWIRWMEPVRAARDR